MSDQVRKEIYFSGNVQGVGFRYRTTDLASSFAVTGTVQNLSDGRVKLVVEGTVYEVQGFLFELRQLLIDHIDRDECLDSVYTGEFTGFSVLR